MNPIRRLDNTLSGWPDTALTLLLFGLALLTLAVALFGSRIAKAGVAAWVLLP